MKQRNVRSQAYNWWLTTHPEPGRHFFLPILVQVFSDREQLSLLHCILSQTCIYYTIYGLGSTPPPSAVSIEGECL